MADEGRPPLSKHAMVRGVLVGVASIYNRDTSSTTESDGALQGREDRRGYVPEVLLHIDHQQHRSGGVGATTPYLVFVFRPINPSVFSFTSQTTLSSNGPGSGSNRTELLNRGLVVYWFENK